MRRLHLAVAKWNYILPQKGKEDTLLRRRGDRGTYLSRNQQWLLCSLQSEVCGGRGLKRHDPVNKICPEDAELSLVVTAKVDKATTTLAGAG